MLIKGVGNTAANNKELGIFNMFFNAQKNPTHIKNM